MEVITNINEMRARVQSIKKGRESIGLVPTMGAIHDGHISLIRAARSDNTELIVSIFLNPTQFDNKDDFDNYPCRLDKDIEIIEKENADVIFAPGTEEMYPDGMESFVECPDMSAVLEGAVRPNHFRGVTTIVNKLFNMTQPDRAYFGEKDYQQVQIIKRMVRDLNMPVDVISVPTVREFDGLAMSSRNVYLTPDERQAAAVLHQTLCKTKEAIKSVANPSALERWIRDSIAAENLADIEMIAIRDADTLAELGQTFAKRTLILLFVRFGKAKLLDNLVLEF